MKTSSKKAKGRALQNLTRDKLQATFPEIAGDIRVAIMGETGADIKLSPAAQEKLPIQIECKNNEKYGHMFKDFEQARSHGGHIPVLVVKCNRQVPVAIIEIDFFLELMKKNG